MQPKFTMISIGLLALGLLPACSTEEKEAQPVVSVQAVEVKQGAIEQTIHADAVLFPIQQAALTAKINAPVKKFYVSRGAKVKAGQLLAVLENRDLAASATENKGSLDQAEAAYATTTAAGLPEEMKKAELDAESAKQALDAEQKLFDSREDLYKQGALPRKDLDQARVALTQARSQYEVAQKHWDSLQAVGREQELKSATGQLESARGKYLGAEAQLSYSEIRSPINGVVAERPLFAGEMAAAGTPLLLIVDTSAVIAKAHIPQQDAALLKIGDSVQLTVLGMEDKIPARITLVSPATDAGSTTVEIWAQAANTGKRLRPGTSVQMSISVQKISNALMVPSSAILNATGAGSSVMVIGPDSKAHWQTVETGIHSDNEVQIKSGVRAGQRVISAGGYGLPDNTQVKVETAQEPNESGAAKPASD
jgi:HlyD family secretion protein